MTKETKIFDFSSKKNVSNLTEINPVEKELHAAQIELIKNEYNHVFNNYFNN